MAEKGKEPVRGWQTNYAKHYGCGRSYICRRIKEGLPFSESDPFGDFEKADRWMAAHSSEGLKHKSKGAAQVSPDISSPAIDASVSEIRHLKSIDLKKLTGDGLESLLERARYAEKMSFAGLQQIQQDTAAEKRKDESLAEAAQRRANAAAVVAGLRRNHAAAANTVIQIERRLLEYREAAGSLVQAGIYRDILEARLNPISSRLDGLPESAAHKVNPDNPHLARLELRKAVAVIRKEIDATFKERVDAGPESPGGA